MSGELSRPGGDGFMGASGFNGNIQIVQNHGYRAFRWDLDDTLRSLIYDYEWHGGVNKAVCARSPITAATLETGVRDCPFPNRACSHGFYAYYGEDYFDAHYTKRFCVVNGVIDGYGRCVIGDKGYRSEYAHLVAFNRPFRIDEAYCESMDMEAELVEEHVCRELERLFPTVPIFDSAAELRKAIPLLGRPPRNS